MARVMSEYFHEETGAKMVDVVVSNNEELIKFEPKVMNENVYVYIVGDSLVSSVEEEKIMNNCINFDYNYMGVYKEKVPKENVATKDEITKTSGTEEGSEKKEDK
ncbi:hypothetical protein FRX31_016617 [Thalictrum thalictroides]|uniref:Uncharacterized protein n=1 Tax=Thalictrum thalictroides TaxID=46969 RepID=A0A7J6WA22_THATH|nr:hypothetical protein FRX31_016617 [Thalictrum thalictroides]